MPAVTADYLPKGVGAQYRTPRSTTAEQTCPFTQCSESLTFVALTFFSRYPL
jgi:hypothetical protein